jgi:hypothetical protein
MAQSMHEVEDGNSSIRASFGVIDAKEDYAGALWMGLRLCL